MRPGELIWLAPGEEIIGAGRPIPRPAELGERQRAWLLHNLEGFAAYQWWFRAWRERHQRPAPAVFDLEEFRRGLVRFGRHPILGMDGLI
jgi:hypothetical protein